MSENEISPRRELMLESWGIAAGQFLVIIVLAIAACFIVL
jgi:hypothetical protein